MSLLKENLDQQLITAAQFIKQALQEEPDYFEIESEDEDKETLVLDKKLKKLSFKEIPQIPFEGKIAAVDGGSATSLSARSFVMGVYRTGYVIFQNQKRVEEKINPLVLEIVSYGNMEEKYKNSFFKLARENPSQTPEMSKILDRLRLFSEWSTAVELVEKLNEGDVILIDGSLRASIVPPYSFLDRLTQRAVEKKIHLVGVSKSSTLYWGKKSPLIPMVMKTAEKFGVDKSWYCLLSDVRKEFENPSWFGVIFVSKLKAASDFAFRVDINRLDKVKPELIFSVLAELSSDPAYLGYPYPLAAIHNQVRITPSEIEDITNSLQSKALEQGVSQADWDLLFTDFHNILNADLNK